MNHRRNPVFASSASEQLAAAVRRAPAIRFHPSSLLESLGWASIAMLLLGQALPGQQPLSWMRPHQGPTDFASSLAHHETRQQTLLVGARTWEWDGTGWHDIGPGPGPVFGRVVDDVARQQLLAYQPGATRLWNGSSWALAATTSGPSVPGGSLAYDRRRQRVVHFGGWSSSSIATDTWEWDGTSWTQRATVGPPGRYLPAMAFCTVRQRVILFGGENAAGGLNDTWEWDGSQWTQLAPATSPPARSGHAMASDPIRGRILMNGGESAGGGVFDDAWIWNGVTWIQEPTSPGGRVWHGAAFDRARDRMVVFGGNLEGSVCTYCLDIFDTWEHDGASWRIANPGRLPGFGIVQLSQTNAVYDSARRRVMRIGFPAQTTIWDGRVWRALHPVVQPNVLGSLADDAARGRVVLFGSQLNGSQWTAETWEWDGVSWAQATTTPSPRARRGAKLVFDAARQRVVLFGGIAQNQSLLADTWTWDGVTWLHASPTTRPPARHSHAMAYDPVLLRVVLFGGNLATLGAPIGLGDTWHWNGTDWAQQFPSMSPGPDPAPSMDHDHSRQRTMMVASNGGVWDWDGTAWTQQTPSGAGPGASYPVGTAAYDIERGHFVVHRTTETFLLGPVQPARVTTLGRGCPGSNGMPSLRTDLPLLGNVSFSLALVTGAAHSVAVFAFDVATQSQPLGGGCTFYLPFHPIGLSIAPTDAAGSAAWNVPIPAIPALRGQVFFTQALALDAGGVGGGFTTTAARRVQLGD